MVPNGLLPNVAAGVTRRLDAERWAVAEERTAELIARIQPTPASEARRRAVADYVQRLIMGCLSCQVSIFGSVPLKTYLPDGDIDVTALSNSGELKDTWAITVRDALEHEEKSENAAFRVREVQYIQAEVKIIKCLVENIVVDISFNQVGGLCTLFFLEEMDNLINQNNLFKRSIVLIKAWCYYESRILGAHHGLISTYALETLVLYIFHVFNNSFAGPLEVLYRFLEFFSNFDWEKFCVSLRGPVPINSLPDMAAEPPRDDDGALLLSRSFLDTCSTKYAVTPPIAQENHVQLFVSKHFNVVDPLRTNNNLGRSVSKGNFFRIRSAFAFGAKRLARLFECPKDDLAVEVEQFFTNTWRRHGSGNRPDAPAQSLIHQPMKVVPVEVPNSHRSTTIHGKKAEKPTSCIGHDNLTGGGQDYHDPTTQLLNKASLQPWNSPRTVHSAVYPTQSQKIYGMQSNTKVSVQLETNSIPGGSLQGERDQSIPKTQFSMDERNGQSRLQFARTNSSPELTDSSVEGFPRGRRTRVVEVEKSSKVDYSGRSNLILGVDGNNIKKSSQDEQVSSVNASPNPSVSVSDLSSVSGSHYEDIWFATNEELASVTEASDMLHKRSQEEHDLADLMASTKLHSFNGQVPLPVQMPSRHSVAPSPMMALAGNSQGNLAGIFPPNFPFIRAPWLPNMQFVHGFVPPPMTHYAASPAFAPNSEDGNESERSVTTDMNCDDGSSWHENGAGLSGNFNQERIDPQMFNFDGKEHSPSLHDVPGAPLQWQLKSGSEDSGALRENYADMFHNQSSGGVSTSASSLSGCMGSVSSQASSRRKTLPDNSSHESTGKLLTSSRDKWGKRPADVAPSSSSCSNTKTSECIPSELDGTRNSNLMPIVNSDFSDGIAGPIPSAQSRNSQVADDHDPLQVSRHNPVFAPILIGSPQQGQDDNSGLTFVPTGPPVPYVVYRFIPGNTDGSVPQFERKEGMDQFPVNMSFGNFGSHDDADELDVNITSTASSSVIADHDGKSDILSSDITSHRQNLQYGRLCQNARPPASMNLQGHFPVDGPGRPPAPNPNWAQLMGPGQRVVPVMDLQPASERASGVFQRYGEDAPRYRGGTGTYLPSPKVPFRDRQSSSRNHRGSYNSDRFYHSDKEGSWVNSKQRNVGRSYGRSPSEKPGTRLDRQTSDKSKNDRQSQSYRNDSYRREAGGPSLVHSHSLGSTNPTRNPGNMTYGVYPQPSAASNGASALSGSPMQPVMMCSYDQGQGVNYGVSGEPIEFGSLGAIPMDGSDIQRPTHEVEANGFYEQRHAPYRGGSSCSSPDQPSSPHLRRS